MKKALLIGVASLCFQIDLLLELETVFASPTITFSIALIIAIASFGAGVLMKLVKKFERMLHCFAYSFSSFLAIGCAVFILDYEGELTHERAEDIIQHIETFHHEKGEYPHKLKYCLEEVPSTALGGILIRGKYLYTRLGNHFNLDYVDSYGEVITYDSESHMWIHRH
ncbi:hypothetical protein [Sediminitomix flava]|uniref:Uncharacterized protein n=1 Tax=Sediminitomix flava TaxID=379075 RepID=A0A315ZBA8_SEDFL|nr:hypothetical protein [Sediminitomix flava]PWJ42582.1 hypothetical protein BC781_102125 [Sediminitomix flava]